MVEESVTYCILIAPRHIKLQQFNIMVEKSVTYSILVAPRHIKFLKIYKFV